MPGEINVCSPVERDQGRADREDDCEERHHPERGFAGPRRHPHAQQTGHQPAGVMRPDPPLPGAPPGDQPGGPTRTDPR